MLVKSIRGRTTVVLVVGKGGIRNLHWRAGANEETDPRAISTNKARPRPSSGRPFDKPLWINQVYKFGVESQPPRHGDTWLILASHFEPSSFGKYSPHRFEVSF